MIEQRLAVTATAPWNRIESDDTDRGGATWTHEGMALDTLRLHVRIKSGDPLVPEPEDPDAPRRPVVRADITSTDIVERLRATWTAGGSDVTLERLEARAFAGHPGFLFRHTFVRSGDGVPMRGGAYGAVIGEALVLIDHKAPRLGYFARSLADVEALAASARLLRGVRPRRAAGCLEALMRRAR